MGGFLGIGGSSAKTDRTTQLQGYGDLSNLFNFGLNQGTNFLNAGSSTVSSGQGITGAGLSTLDQANQYFSNLMSGDRTKVAQAVAPETNTARAQADAQKRNLNASGTSRGGGATATTQNIDTDTMAKVDNLLFGVRPKAAEQEAKIGETEAGIGVAESGIGVSQEGVGANLVGQAGNAASTLTGDASSSRVTSAQLNQQVQDQWAGLIEGALGFFG